MVGGQELRSYNLEDEACPRDVRVCVCGGAQVQRPGPLTKPVAVSSRADALTFQSLSPSLSCTQGWALGTQA